LHSAEEKIEMKTTALVLTAALAFSSAAFADEDKAYEVTITNVTAGQTFTPILAATHTSDIGFFELGQPASAELTALAEGGDIGPLGMVLDAAPRLVLDTATNGALLGPGESVTIELAGSGRFSHLSFAAMLIPTHDTFVALDSMPLPKRSATVVALAYDAGSETNDELCANIPGPYCGGSPLSPMDDGEGFVHVANGIHGIGDLAPEVFDWRNPVATVHVRRIR
jgi:hypothetical protein